MKKMLITLGIAFVLFVGGFHVVTWWNSMCESNEIAYAEHLKEQEVADAERDAYARMYADEINNQIRAYEEAGLYD